MSAGGFAIDLGQYEAQFRDNKIDADVLPRPGRSRPQGHWRFCWAIEAATRAIAAIAGAGPASPAKSAPSQGLQASAERRPITVMFCDLVGSTSLAAKLDAEDWRNLLDAYLDEASKAVTDFGGHVLKNSAMV